MTRVLSFLAAASLLCLTGCVSHYTNHHLEGKTLPYHGEPIDEDTWAAIARAQPQPQPLELRSFLFPLPSIVRYRAFSHLRDTGTHTAASLTWYDGFLGAMGISLPLIVNFNDYQYEPDVAEPVGHNSALYTPFWVTSSSEGEANMGLTLDAMGVPLLFTRVRLREEAPGGGASATATLTGFLWTLGPTVLKLETDDDSRRGYLAAPLLLGGLPGAFLWSDYHLHEDESHRIGHGPAFGFLGYTQWRTIRTWQADEEVPDPSAEERFRRLVLGGTLWQDTARSDAAGDPISTSHGPLWGMFGWGSRGEDFALRAFWIPIVF